jgi:prepilin-type N-terminal cleavage/methylation domain-containing protein
MSKTVQEKVVKAFTLIELLVVISIIGILATLVTANLNAARNRSRDAVRKGDLKNIQTALRMYYNDKQSYPATFTFGETFSSGATVYMNTVPHDPLYKASDEPPTDYDYTYVDSDNFILTACLENKSDTNCQTVGGCECGYQVKP